MLTNIATDAYSPLQPLYPTKPGELLPWGQLKGAALSLAIQSAARNSQQFLLVITPDQTTAKQIELELNFFNKDTAAVPILLFPDWETLPYDHFSPHQDIISQRLLTLYQLPMLKKGILIVSINTLMHRLLPRKFLEANSFILGKGDSLIINSFRDRLQHTGYRNVTQVMEHGEYAVRGSIIDIYPMGSNLPYRIDLFGDEIDSIRTFDTETQRTIETIERIDLLPAKEYPLTEAAITHFRQQWRTHFQHNPADSTVYQNISNGLSAAGIEYYLPLFYENTETLFDYLPENCLIFSVNKILDQANHFWQEINNRYQQLGHDITRPILAPAELFLTAETIFTYKKKFAQVHIQNNTLPNKPGYFNFATQDPPQLKVDHKAKQPLQHLENWLNESAKRTLFCAETPGRREILAELLADIKLPIKTYRCWQEFLIDEAMLGITIAPLENGMLCNNPPISIVAESQLFGQQVQQRRWRQQRGQDADAIIRDLTELKIGSPVVHVDHGVGRYLGLQTIKTGEQEAEFLMLAYANQAKLYVPVSSLHLISRYSGFDLEHAPLHSLGSPQWEKAKRKAAEKIRDVAAELLDIQAQRAAKPGFAFTKPDHHFLNFISAFPFEETPDQQTAITKVIEDMVSPACMDRLICGDVGFGKTEIAIRAAFIAMQSNKQVAVLVPTTLLAEQHLNTFKDRFADWPVHIESISRFRSAKEQKQIINKLEEGKIDIVIGTHRLLQEDIKFKSLGLLIVDEEHRFGVRQKERIKAMRADIDLLTLTATPIPRTLNMSLAGIRDLSIIATPPARRLSVKTFIHEYNKSLIREAVLREITRGGQVYYLHNEVQTITKTARELAELIPEAKIAIGHGQMHEHELEKVMVDFYHQRFNVLVCTTIIESGIDVPTANTIIIQRADRFGLAQLHQLRGRVGRSHHQAYAYLLTPPHNLLTADAEKRLDAIASLEDLGAGFLLATHDLEIRGAGELLGEGQSGHMQEIGFSLYMELLEQTVKALKSGKEPSLELTTQHGTEIDLHIPALIPDNYVPDVHTRLILYKRIASAKDENALNDLQVEFIDRFGLLPPATKNLFAITHLKIKAQPLNIRKIDVSKETGSIDFFSNPSINVPELIKLVQLNPKEFQLKGSERLRFTISENTAEEKIKIITKILTKLSLN